MYIYNTYMLSEIGALVISTNDFSTSVTGESILYL